MAGKSTGHFIGRKLFGKIFTWIKSCQSHMHYSFNAMNKDKKF